MVFYIIKTRFSVSEKPEKFGPCLRNLERPYIIDTGQKGHEIIFSQS